MPVHIPVGTNVDQHVETVKPSVEAPQEVVAFPPRLDRYIQNFRLPRPAPAQNGFVQGPEGVAADRIEQRGRDFRQCVVRTHQIDTAGISSIGNCEILRRPERQIRL